MHPTISGETHKEKKVLIKNRESIDNFIKKDNLNFSKIVNAQSCLYDSFTIENPVFNYINENYEEKTHALLKSIIRNEFDECEKIYPYLGDAFIYLYYNQLKIRKNKSFLFRKNNTDFFINSLKHNITKQIAKTVFDNFSLEYVVNIDYKKVNQVIIEANNNIFFNADYDYSYVSNNNFEIKNYKFLIIEGIIETVGEIHHMLQKASEDKEEYVVFCLGTTPEVKQTILKNNGMGITKVHIVSLNSSEENLNILNDIAVIHNHSDVISATKGQTISQSSRKGLNKGLSIKFEKNGMFIKPLCSDKVIYEHRNFLKRRINEACFETNKDIIIKRLKKFQQKKINIIIPELVKQNVSLFREVNYVLKFFSNIRHDMCKIKINNRNVLMPSIFIKTLENKLNNTKKIINNLDKILIIS